MFEEEMKIGPKGQVVIPQAMRKMLKIHPGSKVIFKLEEGRLILEKQSFDSVGTLEDIARKGPSISKINAHVYEEELRARSQ